MKNTLATNQQHKNILIVDGLNFLVPLVYTSKYYLNSNLIDVYPTYKFLNSLNYLKFMYDIDEIFVIFEIGRDIRKKRISEVYKANRIAVYNMLRTHGDEKIYNMIVENRKMLINIFSKSKVKQYVSLFIEADTIIYGIVKLLSESGNVNNIYVLSNDTDLYQIFDNKFTNNNIKIIRRKRRKTNNNKDNINDEDNNTYYEVLQPLLEVEDKRKIIKQLLKVSDNSELNFILKSIEKNPLHFNIKNFVVLLKTLCGDKGDNIINVRNFGIRSFMKIFDVLCNITDFFNFHSVNDIEVILTELKKHVMKKTDTILINIVNNLLNNKNLIITNIKLVDLEYSFNSIDVKTYSEINTLCFKEKEVDDNEVLKYITEYEINSVEEWSNVILQNILLGKKIRNAIDKDIDRDITFIQKILYSRYESFNW